MPGGAGVRGAVSAPLTSLSPSWYEIDGRRVGLLFDCPTCTRQADPVCGGRVFVFLDPPLDPGPSLGVGDRAWKRTGDTFETLSLSPSILTRVAADGSEHWHGHVTNGQVTP